MENQNPNIPPFGGRNFPPFRYHTHPRQPPPPPPPLHPNFRPQYRSFIPQLQQPQPQRRGAYSTATNSYNTVTTTPSTLLQSSSFVQNVLLPLQICPEFANVVKNTTDRSKQSNEAGSLHDFIEKGSNRGKGWCRVLAGISTSRYDNSQTLKYYDLLLKGAPSVDDAKDHFYYAFDMNSRAINRVRAQQKRKNDDILSLKPTSILKRRRYSQPPSTSTTPTATPASRVSLSPNNSASKYISFEYAASTPEIRTMKTPHHIARATEEVYDGLGEKTELDSAAKRKTSNQYKEYCKSVYSGWNGARCDMEAIMKVMIPDKLKLVRTERMERLEKNNKSQLQMQGSFKKTYNGNRHAQNYFAAGIAMTPNCSVNSGETFIAFTRQSLFAQFGFEASAKDTAKSSPSSATVSKALANLAASCLNARLKQMKDAKHIFLTCDKGHRAGVDHFAKVISWYDRQRLQTQYFTLDMDPAGNKDTECARAVKHSMDQKEVAQKLSGQTTDNGGGATLESFGQQLKEQDATNPDYYSVANCTLHDLSLGLSVPVEKVFGLGGVGKNNFMQMLHSIFDLQKFYGGGEVWKHVMRTEMDTCNMENEDVPRKFTQPVTTRWWWLGISCQFAITYWEVYKRIAQSTVNVFVSSSYGNIVASSIDALMKEELFKGHTIFVRCYTKFLINPHFDFLQSKGYRSKTAGFNSEAILVRLFLIYQDFDSVLEGRWKNHPEFDLFNQHLAGDREPTVLQARQREEEDEKRRLKGSKDYVKRVKTTTTMKKSVSKELQKIEDLQQEIDGIKSSKPSSYWVSLSQISRKSTLDAIMALFRLSNAQITDGVTNKKRNMRIADKKNMIADIEPVEKDVFDRQYTNNETRIMKLELQLQELDLGLKQSLLEMFQLALTEDKTNKDLMAVPLKHLFQQETLEGIEITDDTIDDKMGDLETEIATIESSIKTQEEQIDDRNLLPEDEEEDERNSNNDGQQRQRQRRQRQRQQQQQQDINLPQIEIETRTTDQIRTDYSNKLSRDATIFIKEGFGEITKHFGRWTNCLIFYGMMSESPTSSMVANLLLGQPLIHYNNENTYHSTVHKRDINLDAFAEFLQNQCEEASLIEVRAQPFYTKYKDGITKLANGEKLFDSSIQCVKDLREFLEDVVLGIASNQQFVELSIKEVQNVVCLNRSVAAKSYIGITRAYLNREKVVFVEEELKTHRLHANQYTTAGIKGERDMKFKSKEEDLESRFIAKSSIKTIALIKCVNNLNETETHEDEARIRRLAIVLKSQQENYQREMETAKKNKYNEARLTKRKTNDAQKRRDVDETDVSKGQIQFTRLQKKHIDAVKEELVARDHGLACDLNITQLKKVLKLAVESTDGKQYDKSFHPRKHTLHSQFEHSILYTDRNQPR